MDNNQNTDQQFGAALGRVLLSIFSLGTQATEEFRSLWAAAETRLRNLWDGIVPEGVKDVTYLQYAAYFFGLTQSARKASEEAKATARLLLTATRGMAMPNEGGYAFSDAEIALAAKRLQDRGGSLAVLDDLSDEGRRWIEGGRKGKCPTRTHSVGGKTIDLTAVTSRKRFVAMVDTILTATKAEQAVREQHAAHQAALAEYETAKAVALATGTPLPPEPKAPVKKAPTKKPDSEVLRAAHTALYKGLAFDRTCKMDQVDALMALLLTLKNHCEDTPSPVPAIIITEELSV